VVVERAVIVTGREAQLLSYALDDLLRRGYFDGLRPDDRARIETLAGELTHVARFADRSGQPVDDRGHDGHGLLMNYTTAAQRLDVSERTIRRLVNSGRLPVVCIGGARRIRVTDLEAFVEAR
jgi:excisionase family DNA binding protein